MASIRKEILVNAPPEQVWDAVRDVGAVHQRLRECFLNQFVANLSIRRVLAI